MHKIKNRFDYRKWSIAKQMLWVTSTILIVIFFLIFAFFVKQVLESNNHSRKVYAKSKAVASINMIERNFFERFGDVQVFAQNKQAKEFLESNNKDTVNPQLQQFINKMVTSYGFYDLMMLVDRQGVVRAVNSSDYLGNNIQSEFLIGKNVVAEPWFKACITSKGIPEGAWYSDYTNNWDVQKICETGGEGLAFAAPLKNDSGSTIGVWYDFADWGRIVAQINKNLESESEFEYHDANSSLDIFITDKNHRIIYAFDSTLVLRKNKITPLMIREGDFKFLHSKGVFDADNFVSEVQQSQGALGYKGNGWQSICFVPKVKLSFGLVFSELGWYLFVMLLLLAGSILLIQIYGKSLVQRIKEINKSISDLSKGVLQEMKTNKAYEDELEEIIENTNGLILGLKGTTEFAVEVGSGNFSSQYKALSENDELGNSLISMRDNLAKFKKEDEKRTWMAECLAQFSEILRSENIPVLLGDKLLAGLAERIGINQGAIYLLEEGTNPPQMSMLSCYAWDRKKNIETNILSGEGIVGQVWLEKASIYLTDIPNDFLKIKSGLGETIPVCIYSLPLKVKDEIIGVIELASLKVIQEHEKSLIENLTDNIASSLKNVQITEHTKKLLEKTREMTEIQKRKEMEIQEMLERSMQQEEEIRQNMEEMQATQRHMETVLADSRKRQAELTARMAQVNLACIVSETDLKGNITFVNDKFCEVAKYTKEELLGKPHNIVRHPDMPKEAFKEMWATIGRGKIFRAEVKNKAKDGTPYWVDAIIAPVLGENGKPVKYIGIRYDITQSKLLQQKLEDKMKEMSETELEMKKKTDLLYETLNETAGIKDYIQNVLATIEFTPEGIITNANENFCNAMSCMPSEIIGKQHKIFLPEDSDDFKNNKVFWEKLANGKENKGIFKRQNLKGEPVWLNSIYNPVKDNSGKVLKVIKFAMDVTPKNLIKRKVA